MSLRTLFVCCVYLRSVRMIRADCVGDLWCGGGVASAAATTVCTAATAVVGSICSER